MNPRRAARGLIAACALALAPAAALAQTFPALTGRVVDQANILSPATEASLTERLAAVEAGNGVQVVVATVPSLQGYEIEDFGYRLGRAWGIGEAEKNTGAVFLVAPNERRVRIEVGYGLEPVLTDALSSVILQERVLPRFREGDIEGGVVAGVDAVIEQVAADPAEAQQRVAAAEEASEGGFDPVAGIIIAVVIFWILSSMFGALRLGGRKRRRRGGGLLPIILWSIAESAASSSRGRRGGWSGGGGGGWGGGGGFGGGGFSGGGGSFGGGGASGGW